MGFYIIFNHSLPNPFIATNGNEAIRFSSKEEAEEYLDAHSEGQCAAIVEIIETYDLD